jgi:hypothetical protein
MPPPFAGQNLNFRSGLVYRGLVKLMNCLRCHGLMVTIRLEDAGSSSLCFSGWQCLICGEVIDSVITENRKELHGSTGSRGRIRYGVSLAQGRTPQGDEKVTL